MRRTVATAAALMAVAACGTASSTPVGPSRATTSAPIASMFATCPPMPAPAAATPSRQLQVLSSAPVPIDGHTLEVGLGSVWAASSQGLVALSIPAAASRIVVGEPVTDVALSATRVYAVSDHDVLAVDPAAMQVTQRWTLSATGHSLATSEQAVYVGVDTSPPTIERIDLQTGAVVHSVVTSLRNLAGGHAVAYGAGTVWVTGGGILSQLDPTTLSLRASTELPSVGNVWFGSDSLWAANAQPAGVYRINPASGCVVAAQLHSDAVQIAFSAGAVWLAAAAGPTSLDPTTAAVVATTPKPEVRSGGSDGIAVVGNEVWTCYPNVSQLQRLQAAG